MNNNHFSLMRYFRDMGIDAYLLLYSNDGTGANAHFIPENDTWNIEKWKQFIIQTPIPNGGIKGIIRTFANYYSYKKYFNGYDYIIGNGFAPALCYIFQKRLDLFLPYSLGVEFTWSYRDNNSFLQSQSDSIQFWFQNKGLKDNVDKIGTIDFSSINLESLKKLRIKNKIHKVSIPMVYSENNALLSEEIGSEVLSSCLKRINESKLSVFSHVSHVKYSLGYQFKRNDILIKGVADYIKKAENPNIVLILVEYGDNLSESKRLIGDLGIENYVLWLPKLSRKELMLILPHVTIGGGEYGGVYWGGTGWEFLACGVPFFQNTGMAVREFEEKTGTPMPDIFNVRTAEEITNILMDVDGNKIDLSAKSENLIKWFHSYNGKAEAERIFSLITKNT